MNTLKYHTLAELEHDLKSLDFAFSIKEISKYVYDKECGRILAEIERREQGETPKPIPTHKTKTMQDLEQLEQSVIEWAEDKEIFRKATPYKQAEKTMEECCELIRGVSQQETWALMDRQSEDTENEIKDAIGDIAVTIIIQAKMQGLTLTECLQSAYDVIKTRTGQMIDGQFVKDK